jgi:DNA-3-methyladenine glycosylase
MPLLPRNFYTRPDVIRIARELLGKYLVTRFEGKLTSGIIVETEAYEGATDKASHAYGNRRTARTEIMYRTGGTAYVYLCYGVHSLFNVVTNVEEIPHAVLVRGIIPVDGQEIMRKRSGKPDLGRNFGIGPGKVSKILGIHYSHTGLDLTKKASGRDKAGIWLEDRGFNVDPGNIKVTARIGVQYSGEDALKPYRFILTGQR